MIVAGRIGHKGAGYLITNNPPGAEYTINLAVICAVFLLLGPGRDLTRLLCCSPERRSSAVSAIWRHAGSACDARTSANRCHTSGVGARRPASPSSARRARPGSGSRLAARCALRVASDSGSSSRSAASPIPRTRAGWSAAARLRTTGATSPCIRASSTSRRAARQRASPSRSPSADTTAGSSLIGGGSSRAQVHAASRRWRGSSLRSAGRSASSTDVVRAADPLERARRRAHDARVAVGERGDERRDEQHRGRIVRRRVAGREALLGRRAAQRGDERVGHASVQCASSGAAPLRRTRPSRSSFKQVRAHRAARGQVQRDGVGRVHARDDLGDRREPRAQRRDDLLLALMAVVDVLAQLRAPVADHRPVRRVDRGGRFGEQALERAACSRAGRRPRPGSRSCRRRARCRPRRSRLSSSSAKQRWSSACPGVWSARSVAPSVRTTSPSSIGVIATG